MRPFLWTFLFAIFLAACSPSAPDLSIGIATETKTAQPSASATIVPTLSPTALPSPSPTTIIPEVGLLFSSWDVGEQNLIALTIDDGYGRIPFDSILDSLRERNLQATYFLVAQAAQNLGAERIIQLIEDGHHIAYHSFSHDDLNKLENWQKSDWIADYEAWKQAFTELVGEPLFNRAFRPYARAPYGLFNLAFLAMTEDIALAPVGWSKDPGDLARGIPMQSGDIFLFHVRFPDADLMGPILDESEYEFVTLDELIAAGN